MTFEKMEQLIGDSMKSVFGFALTRLGDTHKAEDLASDILYELVRSLPTLRDEERFYGFLWKVAERTYADYLRRQGRRPMCVGEPDEAMADETPLPLEEIIHGEELNLLRRELSLLSEQYRTATVLYYMDGLSCTEIAQRLSVSTEMVKYYLFRARKTIREGMNMERLFGEKSYRPQTFAIDFWGTKGGEDREYSEFRRRKIKGNILLAAYYAPVTIQEISIELGVSLPYLEDEIALLCERQYLICKNGKYLTNIPVFSMDCSERIQNKLEEATAKAAKRFVDTEDNFAEKFGSRCEDEDRSRWQKLMLCFHLALLETDDDLACEYGELPADGPYALVRGGGGQGIIWGRCAHLGVDSDADHGIQGIYNGYPSDDGRGSVIAMNFRQTLNAQRFEGEATPVVCVAAGCYEYLPREWQENMTAWGYARDGKATFPIYTQEEYRELSILLRGCVQTVIDLNRETMAIAARITADLAPAHIKETAAYVGAFVHRFVALDRLVEALWDTGWLSPVDDTAKPAMCVVLSR